MKKSLGLGALLGGGLLWLTTTKKGKEWQKKVKAEAASLKKSMMKSPKFKEMASMSKEEYLEAISSYVDEYIKDNAWLKSGKTMLVEFLEEDWDVIKADIKKSATSVKRKAKKAAHPIRRVKKTVKKKAAPKKATKKKAAPKKKVAAATPKKKARPISRTKKVAAKKAATKKRAKK